MSIYLLLSPEWPRRDMKMIQLNDEYKPTYLELIVGLPVPGVLIIAKVLDNLLPVPLQQLRQVDPA